MNPMTVRDQPEPSIAGAAADRAEPAGCAPEERRLRADAARNRDAIVAVARDVFAEHGLEAPLEAIAARAGVGIATLYRRFPTREKLVAAALVEKVAEYTEAARQALAAPDPWADSPALLSGSANCIRVPRGRCDVAVHDVVRGRAGRGTAPDGQPTRSSP